MDFKPKRKNTTVTSYAEYLESRKPKEVKRFNYFNPEYASTLDDRDAMIRSTPEAEKGNFLTDIFGKTKPLPMAGVQTEKPPAFDMEYTATKEALNLPGRMVNEGISEIGQGEVVSGSMKTLEGAGHGLMALATVPLAIVDDALRSVGLSDPADALNFVFNLPAQGVKEGQSLIDSAVSETEFSKKFNEGMKYYLLSKGISEKEQEKIKGNLNRANELFAILLSFKALHKGTQGIKKAVGAEKVTPITKRGDISPVETKQTKTKNIPLKTEKAKTQQVGDKIKLDRPEQTEQILADFGKTKVTKESNKLVEPTKQAEKPQKDVSSQITETPRSELPKGVSDKILNEAKDMKAELEAGKVEKGKSFFNEELSINGKYTINTLPQWFREIKGDKKAILNALDKIIKDKGLDTGVMVERVKSKIVEHLSAGKEYVELHTTSGKQKAHKVGEKPPDVEMAEFLTEIRDKKITKEQLSKAWDEFESATKFDFGANTKKSEPNIIKNEKGFYVEGLNGEKDIARANEIYNKYTDKAKEGKPFKDDYKGDNVEINSVNKRDGRWQIVASNEKDGFYFEKNINIKEKPKSGDLESLKKDTPKVKQNTNDLAFKYSKDPAEARQQRESQLSQLKNEKRNFDLAIEQTKDFKKRSQLVKDRNKLSTRISKLEDALGKNDLFDKSNKGQADIFDKPTSPTIERLKAEVEQAKKNIKEKGQNLNSGIDPTLIKDYAVVGYDYIRKGATKFKDWSKSMIKEFGEKIKPHLQKIWKSVQESFGKEILKLSEKNPISKPLNVVKGDTFAERILKDRPKEKKKSEGIELPDETILQKVERKILDKYNRSTQLIKEARKKKEVSEEADFRSQMELFIGRVADKLEIAEDVLVNNKTGLLKKLNDNKLTETDLAEYLYARHAKERNAYIESEFGKKNGSGISDIEANKILDKYKGSPVERLAKLYDKNVTQKALKELKDSGILSEKDFNDLSTHYKNYVPLKGKAGAGEMRIGGQNFSVGTKGIFRAKGRESIPNDPFYQGVIDLKQAIIRAEKNKVNQSLLKFIEENPNKELYEVHGAKKVPSFNAKGELQKFDAIKLEDNQISAWVDGKQKIITIKDPALLRGFKTLGVDAGLRGLNSINNYLRTVITMANPEFIITNFQRDIQTALINIGGEKSAKLAAKTAKDVPSALKGIWKEARGKKPNEWTEIYKDFKAQGAKTGWMDIKSLDELAQAFEKKVAKFNQKGFTRKAAHETLQFIEDINLTVENGVRLSAYKNAIDAGLSKAEAARLAKNLTVNFNRKGEWSSAINSLYLFWNAGAQGAARTVKALKSKNTRRIGYGLAGMSLAANLINKHINPEAYNKLSDYEKDGHWIFMLPDGKYLKIKLPYGYNVFNVMGNVTGDLITDDITKGKAASRTLGSISDSFNPFGATGSLGQFASPTLLDPVIQISENKNFFGSPIKPGQPAYQPKKPESQLYFKSVNPIIHAGTDMLNNLTGGSEVESGALDISPETVEHIIEFAGGGLGKFIANTTNTGVSLLKGEVPELNKMPLVRKAVGEPHEFADMAKVYDMRAESGRTSFSDTEKAKFKQYVNNSVKQGHINEKQGSRFIKDFIKKQKEIKQFDKAEDLLSQIEVKPDIPEGVDAKEFEKEFEEKLIDRVMKNMQRLEKASISSKRNYLRLYKKGIQKELERKYNKEKQ